MNLIYFDLIKLYSYIFYIYYFILIEISESIISTFFSQRDINYRNTGIQHCRTNVNYNRRKKNAVWRVED